MSIIQNVGYVKHPRTHVLERNIAGETRPGRVHANKDDRKTIREKLKGLDKKVKGKVKKAKNELQGDAKTRKILSRGTKKKQNKKLLEPLEDKELNENEKTWIEKKEEIDEDIQAENEYETEPSWDPETALELARETQLRDRLNMQKKSGYVFYQDITPDTVLSLIPVQPFDMNLVKPDYTIAILGKRRTGKSWLLNWIMFNMRGFFPRGICFTRTKFNGFWSKRMPTRFIHEGYKPQILREFLDEQKEIYIEKHKNYERNKHVNIRAFIIFDDVISQTNLLRFDETLKAAWTEGRHYEIFVAICSQTVKGVSAELRTNTDMIFTFVQKNGLQREAVAKDLMTDMNHKSALVLLDYYTTQEENTFLCLDVGSVHSAQETYYTGKAAATPNYILGCREYWGPQKPGEYDSD